VWHKVTQRFAEEGGNMLLVDVGDAFQLKCHPEIATGNAWDYAKIRNEIARIRDLGMEPIPKLNFSTCHDAWMGVYARMVSTPQYYQFCHEVIGEVYELFGKPSHFHIGMDEETFGMQANRGYAFKCVRENPLWFHDVNFLCEEVRRLGARPWMWADKIWDTDPEEYSANIPRDVLQSNWYYKEVFKFDETTPEYLRPEEKRLNCYLQLEQMGYDQVPCGSNWARVENYPGTLAFARKNFAPERFKGMMLAPWCSTEKIAEEALLEACQIFGETHRKDESK